MMATIDWPSGLSVSRLSFGTKKSGVQWRSAYNGFAQSVNFVSDRWMATLTMPMKQAWDMGVAEAMFNYLAGGVNLVRVYHFGRPAPVGTLRGSPLISSASARGSDQIAVLGSGTLVPGDMLGVSGQIFQVREAVTVTNVGVWVKTVNRVRAPISIGASVVWDKPTVAMNMPAFENMVTFSTIVGEEFTVNLEEVVV